MTNLWKMQKNGLQEHVVWPAYNPSVGTSFVTIWSQSGRYPFNYFANSTPQGLRLVSTSANDAAEGSGANAFLIYGERVAAPSFQELIIPNGTTPVVSAYTDWLWVSQVIVVAAGNGANTTSFNAGAITVAINGGPGDGQAVCGIQAGANRSTNGVYRVPPNRYLYLDCINAGGVGSNARLTFELYVQETYGGVFYKRATFEAENSEVELPLGIKMNPRTCLEIIAKTDNATKGAHAQLSFYFYNEDQLKDLGLA